jgi:hypothetical protein
MIRKAIILILTLGAVGTVLLDLVGRRWDITCSFEDPTEDAMRPIAFSARDGRLVISTGWPHGCLTGVTVTDKKVAPGIHWFKETSREHTTNNLQLPLWHSSVLLALYPTIAFIRSSIRRWRRRGHGLCVKCSYDLTGNESGVCPECGTRIDSA